MTQLQKRWKEIEPLELRKEKFGQALKEVSSALQKHKKILVVILFGSVARGDFSPRHSDIDLFVFIDEKEPNQKLEQELNALAIGTGNKYKITIHLTFQYLQSTGEDQSLLKKIIQEGRVLFSRDILVISKDILGLKPYELIIFNTEKATQLQRTKFSRFLHGASLWYKKRGQKIVRNYPGIIDRQTLFKAGRGALLIAADKVAKIQELAEEMGITVKSEGTFYR